MTNRTVRSDKYLAYSLVKLLITPFTQWDAYKAKVIAADGTVLVATSQLSQTQRNVWGEYEYVVSQIKRSLERIPGGISKLGVVAAAYLQLKGQIQDPNDVDTLHKLIDTHHVEKKIWVEEAPVNAVGGGSIAGLGVGPAGEPGVSEAPANKYKRRNAAKAPRAGRQVLSTTNLLGG